MSIFWKHMILTFHNYIIETTLRFDNDRMLTNKEAE